MAFERSGGTFLALADGDRERLRDCRLAPTFKGVTLTGGDIDLEFGTDSESDVPGLRCGDGDVVCRRLLRVLDTCLLLL